MFCRWASLVGCFIATLTSVSAQATWNFSANTGAPTTLPANVSGGTITAANPSGGSLAIGTTSASSGYAGASGGNNAALRVIGAPLSATSTYIEFTLSASAGYKLTASGLSLGSRGTDTGPTRLTLYASTNNYVDALAAVSVSANATWALVTLPSFSVTSAGGGPITFRLYASDGSASSSSANWRIDDVSLTVSATAVPVPVISSQPAGQTVTVGDGATFSVAATGTGVLSYQWRKNGAAITGNTSATTSTLSLPAVTSASAGSYTVVITDDNGSTTSAAAVLTVNKASATVTFNAGSLSATYTGSPQQPTATTNPADRPVTFTFDGGATAPTSPGSYTVVATINDPDYAGSATDTFTIGKATATITLGGLIQTYDGTARVVTATTSPGSLAVDITYSGAAAAPASIGSYPVAAVINDPNYQGSTTGVLTILPLMQTITFASPGDHLSTDAPFTLNATASSGLPVSFAIVGGGNLATLAGNVVTLTGGLGMVTVQASQSGGGNFAAAPTVERVFHVVEQLLPPTITTAPVAYTGHVGDPVTLTAAATGTPAPALQWYRNGVAIAGATGTTLTIASAAVTDTGLYTFSATNSVGAAATIPVAVNITKKPQTLTLTDSTNPLPAGTRVGLAAFSNSGLPVTLTLVSGAGSLVGNQLTGSGGNVVIRATQAGDAIYAPITVERTYTFVTGGLSPFITIGPADQVVAAGSDVTFRSTAVGTPAPTYQWEKDGEAISGATAAVLTLSAVTLEQAGRYAVVASNSAGSARASATLTVRAAPVIVTPPADQFVAGGNPATFSVVATGYPVPTYQWRRNGTAIPGATGGTFTIATPRNSDEGRYDVTVTNELGSVTSTPATLDVDMKDVTGTYFGRFGGTTGAFALHVREDGTAALIGHLAGLRTGIATTEVTVDYSGNFAAATTTLAATPVPPASPLSEFTPPAAAAPQPVTVRGTLDEATGALTGSIPELGLTLEGTRAARTGAAAAQAGFYRAALVGSADGRGYIAVAPDGQAFVFTASGAALDSGSGTIGSDGRLRLTTSTQAAIDVGFNAGVVSGTARVPGGTAGAIAGASTDWPDTQRLVNLSVRSITAPNAPLITGFVIGGTTAKQVLIRAAGPAIGGAPFNVPNALGNPAIQVLRGSAEVAQNENWGTPAANGAAVTSAAARAGSFPFRTGSADAAVVRSLTPGAYTVMVTGGSGVVLAEIYESLEDGEAAGARRLINLSARGAVTAASPLIGGFVITGQAPQRVLIRGIGPALARAPFNVASALDDTRLTLFRGNTVIKTNQAWFRDPDAALIRSAATAVGAFALGAQSLDSAMLIFLAPGAYTAQVTGVSAGDSGVALVEVYEVP